MDTLSPTERSARMSLMRGKDTGPELVVRRRLNATSYRLPKSRLDFWRTKLDGNRRRDARTLRALRSAGWRVLVVWECQLRDLPAVADRLHDFLDA